ncbi:hypothetical protein BCR36DRAFT_406192 [Piromyces finnis]|uniref:Uncharacterized protein n=1 Tax=Piromyces finnis TaxID=1754191 RepID=A0A1Y1V252_9FUNG|nr:hypothetical protein BCR36DRAFT_406192 [Piromyces finnis]|eukprot:ORX44811.1 hypothetical protein BCR36DRAFT_406192 [Piromyces finnis]
MVLNNVGYFSSKLLIRGFLIILFFITVNLAIYYNKNDNVIKHYTTATPVIDNPDFILLNIPKDTEYMTSSSSSQLVNYHKSNQDNIIPLEMCKNEKNTGTLSLLSLSIEQDNNTYYLKQKNRILKKLNTINKKLKKTLKQLQASTTQTLINFNFNYTQLIEDFYSIHETKICINSKFIKNSKAKEQRNFKQKNSSIPKICLYCLKYFQKNKAEIQFDSCKSKASKLELISSRETKYENKNKENKYISHLHYSSLKNGININKNNISINSPVSKQTIVERNSKTILERNVLEKENYSKNELSTKSKNENGKLDDPLFYVNKTKSKDIDINFLNHVTFSTKSLEENIFASPGGLALVLFILYAIFMF